MHHAKSQKSNHFMYHSYSVPASANAPEKKSSLEARDCCQEARGDGDDDGCPPLSRSADLYSLLLRSQNAAAPVPTGCW